ncbi:MAG: hypothetical protein QNK05_16515 [Myxococcota bacterium]|nr:hypothetical protein [Myxococcota bacterium]
MTRSSALALLLFAGALGCGIQEKQQRATEFVERFIVTVVTGTLEEVEALCAGEIEGDSDVAETLQEVRRLGIPSSVAVQRFETGTVLSTSGSGARERIRLVATYPSGCTATHVVQLITADGPDTHAVQAYFLEVSDACDPGIAT